MKKPLQKGKIALTHIESSPGDFHPFGVLNVEITEDEEVLWHWSHQEGKSYVSGYSIRKKNDLEKLL